VTFAPTLPQTSIELIQLIEEMRSPKLTAAQWDEMLEGSTILESRSGPGGDEPHHQTNRLCRDLPDFLSRRISTTY
jgi:hypothetical protein